MDDLGLEEGLENFNTSKTVLLLDADTVAFAAAFSNEYADDVLTKDMYSTDEWEAIINDKNYDAVEQCIWKCNVENAVADSVNRINAMLLETGCGSVEAYFTIGLNFRHTVDPLYKSNRAKSRYPSGNRAVKEELHKLYAGELCEGYEADDVVVALKQLEPDKYVLAAIDKDVLNNVSGRHYNYYYSERYNISPKWVTISDRHAMEYHPLQTLVGDPTDCIKGCPSVGKVGAAKLLKNAKTIWQMWNLVHNKFLEKGVTFERMMQDARLTGMHQLERCDEGKWCWSPFKLPTPEVD